MDNLTLGALLGFAVGAWFTAAIYGRRVRHELAESRRASEVAEANARAHAASLRAESSAAISECWRHYAISSQYAMEHGFDASGAARAFARAEAHRDSLGTNGHERP